MSETLNVHTLIPIIYLPNQKIIMTHISHLAYFSTFAAFYIHFSISNYCPFFRKKRLFIIQAFIKILLLCIIIYYNQ